MTGPTSFSTNLLMYSQRMYQMSDSEVYRLVTTNMICVPKGCIDPSDIGTICCPF